MNALSLNNVFPIADQTIDAAPQKAPEFQWMTLNELDFIGGGADIVNLG